MKRILFAGEGGQGIQLIAEILAQAAFFEGKSALYIPNFGVEQRGGVSLAFVVIDEKPVLYPKFSLADVMGVMSKRCCQRISTYQGNKTRVIFQANGPAANINLLGQINKEFNLVSKRSLINALEERLAKQYSKNPTLRKINLEALNK